MICNFLLRARDRLHLATAQGPEPARKRAVGKTAFANANEVNRFRRIIGLSTHCIRLIESLKPDGACALQRKTPGNQPVTFDGPLSPVRFKARPAELRRFSTILAVMQPYFSAPRLGGGEIEIRTFVTFVSSR
jgi:hypothetical protein